jgi:Dolichyl-phosphate-mannose-protein mannosyltransferase
MTLLLEPEAEQGNEREPVSEQRGIEVFPTRFVLAGAILSIALRARFITTPLSEDEGGYLAVARAWASGKSLYTQAWVDRPQGLLVLFRLWDDLTGGSAEAIRVMAIVFGCVAVFGVAYAVFALAGRRAAAIAAVLVAVASANARIEGFIANGELLAGAVAAAGVAAACAYLFRDHGRSWLFASGLLAGLAMSLKQSGFDGFLAVMVCIAVGGLTRERRWREVVREGAICVAGVASVLAALFLDGLFLGFHAWWYAIAGYRIGGLNASDADWHRFNITSHIAEPTILPLAIAATVGVFVWIARSGRIRRSTVLVPAWICFAVVAFVTGGLFHRHYWVTLTFPFAAAAAIAIGQRWKCQGWRGRLSAPIAIALTCLVAIPSLISTAHVVVLGRDAAALEAHDDPRLVINEHVAQWYSEHKSPGSTLYVLCASAALYAEADAIAPYPYLWLDGVQHGRGAQPELVSLFAGPAAPTFVAKFQSALSCNPTGQVAQLLRDRYTVAANLDGTVMLELRDGEAGAQFSGRRAFPTVT